MNFESFLTHLKDIVWSPLGFIAFILLACLYTWLFYVRSRLAAIRDLPNNKRAEILAKEYGVEPRGQISGDQWIRDRRNRMLLFAFIFTLLMLFALSVLAISQSSQVPDRDLSSSTMIDDLTRPVPVSTDGPQPEARLVEPLPVFSSSGKPKGVVPPRPQEQAMQPTPLQGGGPASQDSLGHARGKQVLEELIAEVQEQIRRGQTFDFADLRATKSDIRIWKETNEALVDRIDEQMQRVFRADTSYGHDFDAAVTRSFHYFMKEEQEQESIRKDIENEVKKLSSLLNKIRRDVIRYNGAQP